MQEVDKDRIGRDLWPQHRKYLVRNALADKKIRLSIGEAETLARSEVEREVNARLRNSENFSPSLGYLNRCISR